MARVVHVIATSNFAGAERYVCDAANETMRRGWAATVVGGNPERMRSELEPDVRWLRGSTFMQALQSVTRLGPQEICHAHMTIAETVAAISRPRHRAPIVSTRHFATRRGSSLAGGLLSPWIATTLARQIAISDWVAQSLERRPDAVVQNGVGHWGCLWRPTNRTVLVLQRLESEKDTLTALRAWQASQLDEEGWSLRVVGEGTERRSLEEWTASNRLRGVTFAGWTAAVAEEFARAGILLAPAPGEPFGLSVVEAMAAGVPVVAAAAGGHLETVGRLTEARMFPPGDADTAAAALRSLLSENNRADLSEAGRSLVAAEFTIERHVDSLLVQYSAARGEI